jgi:hypothetical protein
MSCNEKYQLEEGNTGGPSIGWNFAQRVIVDELPDVFLDGCPHTSVKAVYAPTKAGMSLADLEYVVFYDKPLMKLKGSLIVFTSGSAVTPFI